MAGGKIQHWKHGWIPISPDAKAYVAGRGPKPRRGVTRFPEQLELFEGVGRFHSEQVGGYKITRIDGYPEVVFSQDLNGWDADLPEDQMLETAEIVKEMAQQFPYLKKEPVIITIGRLPSGTMGETLIAKPHNVTLNKLLWNDPSEARAIAADMKDRNFGMTAQIDGMFSRPINEVVAEFRRNVIRHELAHVIHNRDDDRANLEGGNGPWIEDFTKEKVTPREMGFTAANPFNDEITYANAHQMKMDRPVPRWMVDVLRNRPGGYARSIYAMESPAEFFAEALTDGLAHGVKASESGKRAVELARRLGR